MQSANRPTDLCRLPLAQTISKLCIELANQEVSASKKTASTAIPKAAASPEVQYEDR